uniref:carotenoid 9,10-dioxygenase n=1 Tax=Chlamydomonas leiostraca TaxID=1034604 RepID=A0A7S0WUG4_9CHLO|eukprot:CAMPEP_0202867642 /NCGR_PEP_ID=MMETSP1391-20130828/9543_1 /ASSEMBLY_ACC=CAM_ASM_000867 /TAXON_ID=1034604 /ORGANISM="Chlamydomonas leiostraca, Strain SAG 11-49" /LENGTH=591 /DNA_ID=CAMNT_0049547701 /DNA_START=100 /DNA_END=1875 /DNA_ORIENTATION=-
MSNDDKLVHQILDKAGPVGKIVVPLATIATTGVVLLHASKWLVRVLFDAVARGNSGAANPGADYLAGNFGPVRDEIATGELEVEGTLPADLSGAYVRTGPNPALDPVGGYHWFDGDGMLHGVRLRGGRAVGYANHQVRTARLAVERKAGRPLYMKMGDIVGKRGLLILLLDTLKRKLGICPRKGGSGTANTALVFHARRLLALHEGDLPYAVRVACDGVIDTLGRLQVGGPGSASPESPAFPSPFTAHPKVDARTGEMFFFGYSFDTRPYVRAGLMDKSGALLRQWAVHTPWPAMMHDCAITENYAVLLHMPLCFDGEAMVKRNSLPLAFMKDRSARIGLLRRDAPGLPAGVSVLDPKAPAAPVTWFELPAQYVFHVANAWEDGDGRVHVFACTFPEFSFNFDAVDVKSGGAQQPRAPPPESERQRLTEYVLDPATGKATSTQLSATYADFPVMHPGLVGYRSRWAWGATFDYKAITVEAQGIAKYDLLGHAEGSGEGAKDACVGHIRFPEGCYGGEAYYVPRHADPTQGAEDDGWLLVYVYDSRTDSSTLNVYDAATMAQQPLARVRLPRRVPYGFHSLWVREEQLAQQA